ncbi:MAG: mechanosensitive ion channel family protein [Thermomicrobiales bacterium]
MPEEVTTRLENLLDRTIDFGWVIVLSLVILWVTKRVRRHISDVVLRRGGDANLVTIIDNIVRIAIFTIIGLMIIGTLTGDTASSVTAIGLITAAISLSLQDVLRNFVSGLYLLIERPFKTGDTIRIADQGGKVERVDIRTTVIRNAKQEEVFIPNFNVFSQVVRRQTSLEPHKYTITSPYPVTETYDSIWSAAISVQGGQQQQPPTVQISGATADSVEFEVILWDPYGKNRSDAFIAAVKANLEKATIKYLPPS